MEYYNGHQLTDGFVTIQGWHQMSDHACLQSRGDIVHVSVFRIRTITQTDFGTVKTVCIQCHNHRNFFLHEPEPLNVLRLFGLLLNPQSS